MLKTISVAKVKIHLINDIVSEQMNVSIRREREAKKKQNFANDAFDSRASVIYLKA